MDYSSLLIGMSEPCGVKKLRRDLGEFVSHLPKDSKGFANFSYAQAVGHQKLQFDLQRATTLTMIDCETHVATRHARPNHYLKAPPIAALRFDDGAGKI